MNQTEARNSSLLNEEKRKHIQRGQVIQSGLTPGTEAIICLLRIVDSASLVPASAQIN